MAKCISIARKHKKVCIGALREEINIITRTQIAGKNLAAISSDIATEILITVKANVETKQGVEIFDGTNQSTLQTHHFIIRYLAGIDKQNSVQYNSKYFKIDKIENINEENKYLILMCSERGDDTRKVNLS